MNFSPLGPVYMRGGTGCLPGRDVYRDGAFTGTGRLSSRIYTDELFVDGTMRIFWCWTLS